MSINNNNNNNNQDYDDDDQDVRSSNDEGKSVIRTERVSENRSREMVWRSEREVEIERVCEEDHYYYTRSL